jgi:hypothetical protein
MAKATKTVPQQPAVASDETAVRASIRSEEGAQLDRTPQVVYADQLAQVAVGPHVSKLIFGLETGIGLPPRPILTVAIPTPRLRDMLKNVQELLEQPEIKRQFLGEWEKLARVTKAELGDIEEAAPVEGGKKGARVKGASREN